MEILDSDDNVLTTFSTKPDKDQEEQPLKLQKGLNSVVWNMRVAGAKSFDGMVLWGGGLQGPRVVPGRYTARLSVGEDSASRDFDLLADPRSESTESDLKDQFDFLIGVRDKLTEVHLAIKSIRDARSQIDQFSKRLGNKKEFQEILDRGKKITKELVSIEEKLYQTKNQSAQDPLNYPIRLNNRLSSLVGVVSMGDFRPTQQSIQVRDTLLAEIDEQLSELASILDTDIDEFNAMVRDANVPAIFTKDFSGKASKNSAADK